MKWIWRPKIFSHIVYLADFSFLFSKKFYSPIIIISQKFCLFLLFCKWIQKFGRVSSKDWPRPQSRKSITFSKIQTVAIMVEISCDFKNKYPYLRCFEWGMKLSSGSTSSKIATHWITYYQHCTYFRVPNKLQRTFNDFQIFPNRMILFGTICLIYFGIINQNYVFSPKETCFVANT